MRKFLSFVVAIGIILGLFRFSSVGNSGRSLRSEQPPVDPELIEDGLDLYGSVMAACRETVKTHPDLAVRKDMQQILDNIDREQWVFMLDAHTSPDGRYQYAKSYVGEDGRPRIVVRLMALDRHLRAALVDHSFEEVNSSLQSVFSMLILHEGFHIREGHIYDLDLATEERLQKESDAWRYMIGQVMIPAVEARQMRYPIVPTFLHAQIAYNHADPDMWDRFVRVTQMGGDYDAFVADLYGNN